MKRSSAAAAAATPNISAPLSRVKKRSSSFNPIYVAAATLIFILISLGGTLLFFVHSSSNSNSSHGTTKEEGSVEQWQQSSQLRRREENLPIIVGIDSTTADKKKRTPLNTKGLLIRTNKIGDIRINFRPDLAGPTSIQYIIDVVQAAASSNNNNNEANNGPGVKCDRCNFYRAETKLLLQGVLAQHSIQSSSAVSLGPCPINNYQPKLECPPHDPNCGCHGPIMTKGMVGWAGGGKGPDFFINVFDKPVDWWDHQHTVFGVLDEASIRNVERAFDLPAHMAGMRMLDEPIPFSIELF
ncbi:hypothetical protein ACHAWC_011896 [Mediolabrus comicus]